MQTASNKQQKKSIYPDFTGCEHTTCTPGSGAELSQGEGASGLELEHHLVSGVRKQPRGPPLPVIMDSQEPSPLSFTILSDPVCLNVRKLFPQTSILQKRRAPYIQDSLRKFSEFRKQFPKKAQ